MLIRACYLLASSALYRQATEQVERYTATGMRLLERTRDPVQQAQFQRLRGGLFCLQGAYDKSRYYLLEAMDALRGQPRSTAVRLQLAAVYCDYGRVCRQRLEYADACSYYKRALSLLGDLPWPGGVWVYVHYGRAAFALEDHPRARELFQHGYDNAKVSGELWGRTAASAYTAYYQAMEGDYERAAVSLADAQSCQQRLNSPLEGVILHFVSMHIRSRLDLEQRTAPPRPSAHLLPGELRPAGGSACFPASPAYSRRSSSPRACATASPPSSGTVPLSCTAKQAFYGGMSSNRPHMIAIFIDAPKIYRCVLTDALLWIYYGHAKTQRSVWTAASFFQFFRIRRF